MEPKKDVVEKGRSVRDMHHLRLMSLLQELDLPVASGTGAAAEGPGPSVRSQPGARDQARMLAVDDDPTVLRYVRDALSRAGYAPVVTTDPDEALRILESDRPRLVLKVGIAGACLSDRRSRPSATAARFSAAFSRARARLTEGNPPRPISRRRPSMVMRCTQDFPPALLMYRWSPPPSEYRPGSMRALARVADSVMEPPPSRTIPTYITTPGTG